jgi:hypothetical protein
MPAATAAAVPPDDPPAVRVGSHGLRVMPVSSEFVLALAAELGRRGLAEEHGPRLAQARHHRGIDVPGLARVYRPAATQGRPAARQDEVLDRGRHAVEQAGRFTTLPALLAVAGGGERGFGVDVTERVQARIQRVDAREHCARGLDGRGAALAEQGEQFSGGQIGEIGVHGMSVAGPDMGRW